MGKIGVEVKNICGIDKIKANLQTGAVNIVKGKAASGKSSLMRGIHFGIVGSPPMEDKYSEEARILHLDDRTSDQSLLKRGANEGSVTINTPSGTMTATIPSTGMIKGTNSVSKGLFTTMLSQLPPTRLYQAVYNSESDDPNNFKWVVDDLSEAGDYQRWHNVLNALDQEVNSIRSNFNNWKSSLAGADARRDEISKELKEISTRRQKRSESKGADEAAIGKQIQSAEDIKMKNEEAFRNHDAIYREVEAKTANQTRRKDAAKTQKKMAQRRLDEAEDLLEMEFIEPNTASMDANISQLEDEVGKASGESLSSAHKESNTIYQDERDKILGASPRFVKAHDPVIGESGDSEVLTAANSKLKAAKSERDGIVKKYLENRRKFGMAEQQAASARANLQSANATIKEAEQSMPVASATLSKMEENRDASERQFKAASKTLAELQANQSTNDPEDIADQKAQKQLQDELATLENTTTFEIRFSSLNMLANQTMNLSQSDAEAILGTGKGGTAKKSLIKTHLTKGESEIRSLLIVEIDRGILADLTATSTWAAEEADRQRQETRRVFNDVGTTLFNRLKVSQIKAVSLNTDYRLEVSWSDGTTTGLTGSGGERTIIAAALLIAMRKAYTPGVPILMLDGVMESLDPRPREEFLTFLEEYAKEEDIAIVVSAFDSGASMATVMTR
jgi:energy-coupling factor transporter ATP-binding protein EcfA2